MAGTSRFILKHFLWTQRAILYVIIMSCTRWIYTHESTLCSCRNVKKLVPLNRRDIRSLSDSNGIRTHRQLACKRTLNSLAKLTTDQWLSIRLWTKRLWVRILMLSFQHAIPLQALEILRLSWLSPLSEDFIKINHFQKWRAAQFLIIFNKL